MTLAAVVLPDPHSVVFMALTLYVGACALFGVAVAARGDPFSVGTVGGGSAVAILYVASAVLGLTALAMLVLW